MQKDHQTSFYIHNERDKKPWSIQKERRRICFGIPGYIDEWTSWGDYDTREEAEKELAKIHRIDPFSKYQIVDNRYTQWILK